MAMQQWKRETSGMRSWIWHAGSRPSLSDCFMMGNTPPSWLLGRRRIRLPNMSEYQMSDSLRSDASATLEHFKFHLDLHLQLTISWNNLINKTSRSRAAARALSRGWLGWDGFPGWRTRFA